MIETPNTPPWPHGTGIRQKTNRDVDQFQKAIKIKNISAHAIPKLNIEHTYRHNIQRKLIPSGNKSNNDTPTCIIDTMLQILARLGRQASASEDSSKVSLRRARATPQVPSDVRDGHPESRTVHLSLPSGSMVLGVSDGYDTTRKVYTYNLSRQGKA